MKGEKQITIKLSVEEAKRLKDLMLEFSLVLGYNKKRVSEQEFINKIYDELNLAVQKQSNNSINKNT